MFHQVDEYRRAGMDGHVAKPIDVNTLYAAMEEVLAEPLAETRHPLPLRA